MLMFIFTFRKHSLTLLAFNKKFFFSVTVENIIKMFRSILDSVYKAATATNRCISSTVTSTKVTAPLLEKK